jgi:hypothetical protein
VDDTLDEHPVDLLPSHTILDRLIKAKIEGLAKGSASARDVLVC